MSNDFRVERDRLQEALANLLRIIDSPEWRRTEIIAHVHGFSVDEEVGKRNARWIEEARSLVSERD